MKISSSIVSKFLFTCIVSSLAMVLPLRSAEITWSNNGTAWATGSNWVGGVAPANDLTTDIAVFNSTTFTNQPTLASGRSVAGVVVGNGTTTTGALTVGPNFQTLSIGSSGITVTGNASTAVGQANFSGPISLGANQTWTNNAYVSANTTAGLRAGATVTTANNLGNVTLTLAGNGTSGTAPGTASAQNFSIDLVGVVSQGTNSTLSLVVATTGLGAVSLNANSTFSGGVWVKSGIVTMNSALSAGNGTITLGDTSGSANAALKRGSTTGANAITVAAGSSGTLSIESNSNTNPVYSGLVTMSNNLTLATGATGGSLTMNGGFTGSGNLTLLAVGGTVAVTTNDINMNGTITNNGSGSGAVTISSSIGSNVTGVIQNSTTSSLVLSGVNTYGGTTVANSRFIDVRNNLALQNTVVDTTGSGAFTFNASSSTPTLGGLSGAVNLATKFSSGFTSVTSLTLNPQTGVSASYSGNITNGATGMTLTKTGNGTQVLSGVNTYTGGTLVSVGTLIVNNTSGSGTGTGNVTVAAGAVLGGEGIITPGTGRSISVSGVLSPGNSGAIGTLTLNGGSTTLPLASFASGASFEFQLDATTVTSDRISLTSGAAGDIAFNNNNIAFTLNGSLVTGQTYTLFTSNVAGAFTGLTFVDGKVTSGLTFSGLSGAFQSDSYISQSGNNLVLNAVPEPATWALLALGFAAFVFLRRQRA